MDCWEVVSRLNLVLEAWSAVMEYDNESARHVFLVLVELDGRLLLFFFPQVDICLGDRNHGCPRGVIRVRLHRRDCWDVNDYGHHCADRFRNLIATTQLKMVSNVFKGAMEVGGIVYLGVFKDVVLNPRCFALELPRGTTRGIVPPVAMLMAPATSIVVPVVSLGSRDLRFLVFIVTGHVYLAM
jgi:hypothetical protein